MIAFNKRSIVGISTSNGPQDFIKKYEFVKKSGATPLLLPTVKNKIALDIYIKECSPNSLWINDEIYHYSKDICFNFDSPTTLFYSSGSTSTPKVVVHSDINLQKSSEESLLELNINKPIPVVTSLPLWHVGGMLCYYRSNYLKSELIFTKSNNLLSTVLKYPASLVVLVPSQLQALLTKDKEIKDINSSLNQSIFYLGGASLNDKLIDQINKAKLNVISTYGMTETTGAIATGYKKLKTFKSVTIKQNSDNILSVKTSRSATHYIISNKMVPINQEDGFIVTSDVAEINKDYFLVKGRSDQVFLSGGENISPAFLESLILKLDKTITSAKVLPKKHERLGNEIIVFISPYNHDLVKSLPLLLPHTHRPHKLLPWPKYNGIKPSLNDFLKVISDNE